MTQTLSPTSFKADPLLDPLTFAPLPGSPCLGAASDGGAIGAVQPEPASGDWQEQYDGLLVRYNTVVAERDMALAELELERMVSGLLADSARRIQAERDTALAAVARLRDALTRVGAEVVAALEGVHS
jgi:hypothetical protein